MEGTAQKWKASLAGNIEEEIGEEDRMAYSCGMTVCLVCINAGKCCTWKEWATLTTLGGTCF